MIKQVFPIFTEYISILVAGFDFDYSLHRHFLVKSDKVSLFSFVHSNTKLIFLTPKL